MPTAMAAANCCSSADPTRAVPMRSTASPPTGFGRCLRGRLRSRCQGLGLTSQAIGKPRVDQCFFSTHGAHGRCENIHKTSGVEEAWNFHLPDGTTVVTMHKSLSWL